MITTVFLAGFFFFSKRQLWGRWHGTEIEQEEAGTSVCSHEKAAKSLDPFADERWWNVSTLRQHYHAMAEVFKIRGWCDDGVWTPPHSEGGSFCIWKITFSFPPLDLLNLNRVHFFSELDPRFHPLLRERKLIWILGRQGVAEADGSRRKPVLHIYGETCRLKTKLVASILQKGAQQKIKKRRRRKVSWFHPRWCLAASTVPLE